MVMWLMLMMVVMLLMLWVVVMLVQFFSWVW